MVSGRLDDRDDHYCRWLSRFFFAPGYDRDDIYQEALIAMWRAGPDVGRTAARRCVIDLVRRAKRGPRMCALVEAQAPENIADVVDARVRLRAVLDADLSENERTALGRCIRGEPIRRSEKALGVALWRARRRLS